MILNATEIRWIETKDNKGDVYHEKQVNWLVVYNSWLAPLWRKPF